MKIGEAKRIVGGGLSFESKMPGTSYSLPAKACITGAKLAKVPGTSCSICYALANHGSYLQPNAVKGQQRRLDSLTHPRWVEAMVSLLRHEHAKPQIKVDLGHRGVRQQKAGGSRFQYNETGWHRWHGSGDLQSIAHFARICEVARLTPNIRHWLPTQELMMVRSHVEAGNTIPENLTVRVSAAMIYDGHSARERKWPTTSSVFKIAAPPDAHVCPAPQQESRCGTCRACWDKNVVHVAYHQH